MWLANVAELNIVAVEPRDRTLNTNAVMTDSVVNMFPARLNKEVAMAVDDITIMGKTLDDSRI